MAVEWGLAQGPNAFQSAFSQGLQLGDMVRQRSEERKTSNALSGLVANPQQDDAAFAELIKGLPGNAALKLSQARQGYQQNAAAQQQASQKAAREAIPQQLNMLRAATPENWSQLRAQAIQLGVGSEKGLPAQWDPGFVSSYSKILGAFQEQPDLMTNEVKTILASLPPEQRDLSNPAAYNAVARAAEKLVPLQPGGSAIGYNPATGQSRTVVAQNPGGAMAGTPVSQGDFPRLTNPSEVSSLKPGQQFYDPNGVLRQVPGGPTQSASGGFR